jgi:circadian clock protein KaiC
MHLAHMHRCLDAFKPTLVVVDPISALFDFTPGAHAAVVRMMNLFKAGGTTALFTSCQAGDASVDIGMSSLMDTWIKLIDIEGNGERNAVVYVMKARGLSHSKQLREYRITDTGVDLITACIGPDGVLTGAARLTQEAHEQAATTDMQQEVERRRRELALQRGTLESQMMVLRAALDDTNDEANQILEQETA